MMGGGNTNNEKIHEMLLELAQNEKIKGDNIRAGSYFKAARSVKAHKTPLLSGKQAMELDGVGKKIAEKIDELLSTGSLAKLVRERDDEDQQVLP